MKSKIIKRFMSVAVVTVLGLALFMPRADSAVDLDEAENLYTELCASCHGSSGQSQFPNKDSFTSADDLIAAYDSVSAHGSVSCDGDCVESANTYIWEVLWENETTETETSEPEDLYAANCASCHGDTADDLFPNMDTFTSADELISAYADVSAHASVDDCGDTCVEDTNTYIWDVLWGNGLTEPADIYSAKCASCHGDTAGDLFPNKADFTSADDLITAYADVSAHASVDDCGDSCIEDANAYIWNTLWGNAAHSNTGCFIGSVKQ